MINNINNPILFLPEHTNYYCKHGEEMFKNTKSMKKKSILSVLGNEKRLESLKINGKAFNFCNIESPLDVPEIHFHNNLIPVILSNILAVSNSILINIATDKNLNLDDTSEKNVKFINGIREAIYEEIDNYVNFGLRVFTIDILNPDSDNLSGFCRLSGGKRLKSLDFCKQYGYLTNGEYIPVNEAKNRGLISDNELGKLKGDMENLYHSLIYLNSANPQATRGSDYYPSYGIFDFSVSPVNDEFKEFEIHSIFFVGSNETVEHDCKVKLDYLFGQG